MQYLARLFNTTSETLIVYLIVILVILFLIFLLIREFWCWYLKTTEITYLLGEISEKISEQNKLQNKIYGLMLKNGVNFEDQVSEKEPVEKKENTTFDADWEFVKNED